MRKISWLAIALVALVLHFAATPALAESHAHSRSGFFVGLGLGWGNAGADLNGADPDRANSGSANFRFGWSVAENVTMGLESTSWVKNYDIAGTTADLKLSGTVTAFALTYFPGNMGLYFRGGMGVAAGSAEITDGGFAFNSTEYGLGWIVASGYEWRLTQKMALGPQFQYAYLHIGGDGTENLDFVSLTAQMTWYW